MTKAEIPGGYTNSPPTSVLLEKRTIEKQVRIDWISATFDFVKIEKLSKNLYQIIHDHNFQALLYMLGFQGSMSTLKDGRGKNGYSHSITIGEHIELYYGSEVAKNKHDNYTMQIKMSGSACREYENHLKGDFQKLFKFLLSYDHTTFTRVDFAIDDFSGREISIYDIEHILRSGHYTSAFRKVYYYIGEQNTINQQLPIGFTIQLGSLGSNCLVIYDKKLEQIMKENKKANVDTWYRYEMRFINDKARKVVENYITAVENNDSAMFMKYASSLLRGLLDLRIPFIDGKPTVNKEIKRWDTSVEWLNFLGEVEDIKIYASRDVETTIESKKAYYKRSYKKFMASLYVAMENDEETFTQYLKNVIKLGLEKIDDKDMAMINNYRETKNLDKFDDISEFFDMFNELDGDDDD